MRAPAVVALVGLFVAGCGGGGNGSAKPVAGIAREAAAVVEALQRATATHDFATICDRLLTSSERVQAGGSECPRLMRERAQGVSNPRIRIRSIDLIAGGALVHVQTTASGQAATDDTIKLVRERGRLRIAALGS